MNSMLEINGDQKALLDKFLVFHQNCPKIAHRKIKRYNLGLIFILSHHNESFSKICQHPDLTTHWINILEHLKISANEISNKNTIFKTTMGFYLLDIFYQKALYNYALHRSYISIVDDYLTDYKQHPLYLRQRCIIELNLLRQELYTDSVNLDRINSYVEFALSVGKKYLTPGYLETALLLLETGCFLLKQKNKESKVCAKFAFQMFYEHTYLAQFLEDTEESRIAIKEFYGQRSMFEVNEEKYTNFSFTNYFNLRLTVKERYDVSQSLIDIAKQQAEVKAKDIKKSIYKAEAYSKPQPYKN